MVYTAIFTNLEKQSKSWVVLNLIPHPLLCNMEMTYINRIGQPELCCSFEKDITDPMDDRSLFPLSNIQYFQQVTIALPEVKDVAENIINEILQLVMREHRRMSNSEGFDKARLHYI